ncbi:hypothetical protein [Ectothiorhodospira variabilis]|uniref:hypothetical protein n=1 Tax=Ectothiorhodospira variabilis TaxID=505694 RepID=UPI001EFA58CD|nr:hypothetical protein [Ectothiorhodospira variabilis]MCG5494416.1 hypothetical protein [Ectothiorhodospira variabilis]MCG5503213.1 hypothetical protein [Ectothiorhodospira variabilis]MCG5506028.1 hypothetical protein [Ectothiorhodospira variabilis]
MKSIDLGHQSQEKIPCQPSHPCIYLPLKLTSTYFSQEEGNMQQQGNQRCHFASRKSIICVLLAGALLGCNGGGSSGGGSERSDNSLGLDGAWGGIAEDVEYNIYEISATIQGRDIVRFAVDGTADPDQTGTIIPLDNDVFEYKNLLGVEGYIVTDPSQDYALVLNELWDFGVVQKGASAPYGQANITDLNGQWRGRAIGTYGDGYFRYPLEVSCNSGTCVSTVTGAVVDQDGNFVMDITGQQSTLNVQHITRLYFDFFVLGETEEGVIILSKDKQFLGAYSCPPPFQMDECDFVALNRVQ